MKDGELIEVGETEDIFENPKERYTQELIEAAKLELI
jgi:ABC-type microcin C transport system duplicated ATPase subunit YejF